MSRTGHRAGTKRPWVAWPDPLIMLARADLRLSLELDWSSQLSGKSPAGDWRQSGRTDLIVGSPHRT